MCAPKAEQQPPEYLEVRLLFSGGAKPTLKKTLLLFVHDEISSRPASNGAYPKDSRSNPLKQDVLLRNTLSLFLLLNRMGMPVKSRKRPSRNIIGKRVKEARLLSDPPLTQDQLAGRLAGQAVQLDRVGLAKVESGLRCAFDFEVKALAAVLKVDANWLLGIDASNQATLNRNTQRGKARA